MSSLRVISLVPSLTETMLECGVNVVGRTRFCIHPSARVADIPVVGGTKQVNWAMCERLAPDLVIMDREENTREMADTCPLAWHATHVTSVGSVGAELDVLGGKLQNRPLLDLARDWQQLAAMDDLSFPGWDHLPGLIDSFGDASDVTRVQYMIWRDPWMTISRQTFIGSMLTRVGLTDLLPDYPQPYPTLEPRDLPARDTFYLFSSEPYPFSRYVRELAAEGFNGALVDGEFYSWFGIRSFRLLKTYMEQSS